MDFSESFSKLKNELIELYIIDKCLGNVEEIPYYYYSIYLKGTNVEIGKISVWIGHNKHSYYNGNLGYEIYEEYRGNKYSFTDAKLVLNVAKHY